MSGDHNMYRHYDSPVAMPGEFVEVPKEITLEQYFSNLNKACFADDSAKSKQVAGSHYQRNIQPWDIISEWELDFWEGNVLKYLLRWKHKDGVQDLQKAKHYLEYLIERELNDN